MNRGLDETDVFRMKKQIFETMDNSNLLILDDLEYRDKYLSLLSWMHVVEVYKSVCDFIVSLDDNGGGT